MKNMRILIISNYYPPLELGGWEQLTRDVARLLRNRGHQVNVLTSNHRADQASQPEPDVARELHLESPDHVHYHPHYTLTHRWRERQNRHHLIQAITHFAPDVIFINGMWNLSHSVAWQAEQLCPGRVVYYIASYWPTESDAHTAYWLEPASNPWLCLPKQCLGALARRMLISTAPRNQLDFALVLCVSAFMQDYMIKEAGVPRSQTRVVHNGINPTTFSMRCLRETPPTLRLLYAGRLSPDKGVHTAIEGLGHFLQAHPSQPVTLSVVGSGTPEYETSLKRWAEELGISEAVRFYGQVPRDQMPDIVAKHDVLLFTSIWPEPLARMTQEAMACGLVVIGTETGGTPEILHDGENGLTFEAGNELALADKIAQVAKDPGLRNRLARAARQTIEERFSIDRMVDEIEYYFTSLVNRPEETFE
jgi:glycogen(starch) synthase